MNSLVVCDVTTGNMTVLHTAPVRWSQVVNDKLYFTDINDNLLRKLNMETGEENVLTTEPMYSSIVYKDVIIIRQMRME